MTATVAAEPRPIQALRNDHRRAMRLIRLLVEQLDGHLRLEADDLKVTTDIFRYMVGFVDERHHAREDLVVAALLERDPARRRAVGKTQKAHDELRRNGEDLLRTLSELGERPRRSGRALVPRLIDYAASLAAHFEHEEAELFAAAGQLLGKADWRRIEAAIGDRDDPLFGDRREEEFASLFETYVRRVREIGAPHVPATRAAAAVVESTAAIIQGARGAVSAIGESAAGALHANVAAAAAIGRSRNLGEVVAGAYGFTTGLFGNASAAVQHIGGSMHAATKAVIEPFGSALEAGPRNFSSARRTGGERASWQSQLVNLGLRATMKRVLHNGKFEEVRAPRSPSTVERLIPDVADDVKVRMHDLGAFKLEVFEIAGGSAKRTLMLCPGGGFIMEPTQAHRLMAARMARQMRGRVVVVHYRLAPEHPFPAGLDDCVAAYRHLLDKGASPDKIVIAGDSAGGCLALGTLLRIRKHKLPMPAGAVLISPVTDLSYSGESRRDNRWADPSMPNDENNLLAEFYLGDVPVDDPFASPLFADLSGLPPLLIQVGSTEVLLDDSLRVAEKVRASGGDCECEVWHDMPHDFMLFGMLPEAKKALEHVIGFVERATKPALAFAV